MGRLVWIASYPKSGSTWLRAFLHNYIREPAEPYSINSLMDLSTGESGALRFRAHDPRPPSSYAIADVQRMRPVVHRELMAVHPGLVFVKTHNASLVVEGVPLVTPDVTAGAIYIVRDPRDIAISFSHHLGLSINDIIVLMADPDAAMGGTDDKVYERLSSWSIHVHFWTRRPSAQLHVVRYEDMAAAPEVAFEAVVRFLGQEEAAPDRLARAVRFSAFEILRQQEQNTPFVERPKVTVSQFFRVGKAGQWRGVLSTTQRARIERDHEALMGRFGYVT